MTVIRVSLPIPGRQPAEWIMDLGDYVQDQTIQHYFNRGAFPEPELIELLIRAIRPGDKVVDCGACTGFFSLVMGALGGVVLAIEPGTNNLPGLYRNVSLNNFSIDVRPVALASTTGIREFLLIEDGGVNSFTQPEDRPPGITTSVQTRSLPDLVTSDIRLIKLDIEGAEYEALTAWFDGLWRCPYIVLEYNLIALERSGTTGEQLRALLRNHGYEMFVLFSDGMLPMWVPPKTTFKPHKQNTNVLFCAFDALAALWPELVI